MAEKLPSSCRIWQYDTASGGIENNLKLNEIPVPTPKRNEHLIRIVAASINPVDYKPAEAPILPGFVIKKPATPGCDIAGEIVVPSSDSILKKGQRVFGSTGRSPFAAGGLTEYIAVPNTHVIPIPDEVSYEDAASVPVAAITAYQSIRPHVKSDDRILLNGGSGGVGLFGIQIAKILGCHVTVTCSSRNVDLCRSFGADEVVDYTKGNVVDQLAALPYKFDHVVENVGDNPELFWRCEEYTDAKAMFINIAASPTLSSFKFLFKANVWTKLGLGPKRTFPGFYAQPVAEDLEQIVKWMAEGKCKAHIESRYPMTEVPEAFRQLKKGRTRGKIVINVAAAAS